MANKTYKNWLNDLPERYAELMRGDSEGVPLEDTFARFEAEHQARLAEIEAGLVEADRGSLPVRNRSRTCCENMLNLDKAR